MSFHSGPYRFSSDLETLRKKRIKLNFVKNQTKPSKKKQDQKTKKQKLIKFKTREARGDPISRGGKGWFTRRWAFYERGEGVISGS